VDQIEIEFKKRIDSSQVRDEIGYYLDYELKNSLTDGVNEIIRSKFEDLKKAADELDLREMVRAEMEKRVKMMNYCPLCGEKAKAHRFGD
jgi:DNA-binding protein Fis